MTLMVIKSILSMSEVDFDYGIKLHFNEVVNRDKIYPLGLVF